MNLYLLLPLTSCIACSMLAMAILARDSRHRASRLGAAFALCGAYWAGCEVLWNSATDADVALRLVRMSALGWVAIGPITLHLFLELTSHPVRRNNWLWLTLYGVAAALVVLDVSTPWTHPGVTRESWGWGFAVGPLFPVAFGFTVGALAIGLFVAIRDFGGSLSQGERRQAVWIGIGVLTPLCIASFTDGFLPMTGTQVPRLGATSITLLAGCVAWTSPVAAYSAVPKLCRRS